MRLTLYRKFLLTLIPVFALCAAGGLALVSRLDRNTHAEDLSVRIGNLAGRVAAALDRHDAAGQRTLADDLLGMFGNDAAVRCVELRNATEGAAAPLSTYPSGIGCAGVTADRLVTLPVGEGDLLLAVRYTDAEIARATAQRWMVGLAVMLVSLLATLASASIGFRCIVGRRLQQLREAMLEPGAGSDGGAVRPPLPVRGRDELADILVTYNAMKAREQAQTQALRLQADQLADQGRRDALTGLFNRRHFEQWSVGAAGAAPHRERPGVLALVDIDHFKRVNDTHGHAIGDEVLVAIARRLAQALRPEDLLVRWGGEEFLLYCEGVGGTEALADRLLGAVAAEPVATSAGSLALTASVGLAALPLFVDGFALSLERVLVLADRALYAAKRGGRNRAVCVDALMLERTAQLATIEDDLVRAGQRGLAEVHTVPGELEAAA